MRLSCTPWHFCGSHFHRIITFTNQSQSLNSTGTLAPLARHFGLHAQQSRPTSRSVSAKILSVYALLHFQTACCVLRPCRLYQSELSVNSCTCAVSVPGVLRQLRQLEHLPFPYPLAMADLAQRPLVPYFDGSGDGRMWVCGPCRAVCHAAFELTPVAVFQRPRPTARRRHHPSAPLQR